MNRSSPSMMGAGNLDPTLSSSDSSSKDETGGLLLARVEEDPLPFKVDFHFLKTGTEI